MASFRNKRSRKYRSKNTRKNTRRNTRKSRINRRSKKSLVGGGIVRNWLSRIPGSYWNANRRIAPAPTIESAHTTVAGPVEAATSRIPITNVFFEQSNDQEIMRTKEQLKREIEKFVTSIKEEIDQNEDRNIKEDPLSVEDYIINIVRPIMDKQPLFVELMKSIDKTMNNGISNNEYNELYDSVTDLFLQLNDKYEKNEYPDESGKELAKELVKDMANTTAVKYYKSMLYLIDIAKLKLYI
jgi:hypothetical protein